LIIRPDPLTVGLENVAEGRPFERGRVYPRAARVSSGKYDFFLESVILNG
jgi:hypothetical protein